LYYEKKNSKAVSRLAALFVLIYSSKASDIEKPGMVKMCLFYPNVSGHARSDPILNQSCPSDHVHTFYGPQNFHPKTSYENLRDTKPQYSSSPWKENQSLYWHPSFYEVTESNGKKTYTRVSELESSPYYRWNTKTSPETVAFPPEFRMIAYSNQEGAEAGGETGGNLLVECCNYISSGEEEEEDCATTVGNPLIFPKTTCDFLGIAFAMPTCWDENKGVGSDDPFNHVTYTKDGTVGGSCPDGYNKRIPQVQLFVRINKYKGGTYELADGNDFFHVDFMNGWKKGSLEKIIKKCKPSGKLSYNPPCDCDQFLTKNKKVAQAVCDEDVKQYILDEETEVLSELPRGTCKGPDLIDKSWDVSPPFDCTNGPAPSPVKSPTSDNDEECLDSDLEFKVGKKLRHCEWVAKKFKSRCKNQKIKIHCPDTCDAPKYCTKDSKMLFEIAEFKNFKKCKWVKKNVDARCKIKDICNTCRATCADFDDCRYMD